MQKFLGILLVVAIIVAGLGIQSYNGLVKADEGVDAKWSEIQNQYKRRYDLIPQLVETVKGAADFEKSTITEVTEMRAKIGQMQLPEGGPETEAQMRQYFEAQQKLGAGLGRLMLVAENYPDLKATEAFRDLQTQLEGTENRIGVARRDYIDAIQRFNTGVRSFPKNILAGMFGFEKKPQMTFDDEPVTERPEIDFSNDADSND